MSDIEAWYAHPVEFGDYLEAGWYFDVPRSCIGPYESKEQAEQARNLYYQNVGHWMTYEPTIGTISR
jgi:hypothetical protein